MEQMRKNLSQIVGWGAENQQWWWARATIHLDWGAGHAPGGFLRFQVGCLQLCFWGQALNAMGAPVCWQRSNLPSCSWWATALPRLWATIMKLWTLSTWLQLPHAARLYSRRSRVTFRGVGSYDVLCTYRIRTEIYTCQSGRLSLEQKYSLLDMCLSCALLLINVSRDHCNHRKYTFPV